MKCYKTELDLNNKQCTACVQHAGAARRAYNWGLERKIEEYKAGRKSPTAIDLHRELIKLKNTEFSWMRSVSKCAPQEALRNLDRAFAGFFRRCKTKSIKKGYPKFKSRKHNPRAFTLYGIIHVFDNAIQLPRLGRLRLKEHNYFPTNARVISATVSEKASRWFVAITTNETPLRKIGTETLGADVGVKHLATLSDGTTFENPRALHIAEKRLRLLQKSISRKIKGSSNRCRAIYRIAKQYYRISCIRTDAIHKATNAITKRSKVLGIESLNIVEMLKNHYIANAISDAGMSEFLRQTKYKMAWAKGIIVEANRYFPSSKLCSKCGIINDKLTLKDRKWNCVCGAHHDRDLNAAINLRDLAVSSTVTACAVPEALVGLRLTKLLAGQEPNTI